MTQPILEDLIGQIRRAAAAPDSRSRIRAVLQASQSHRQALAEAIADLDDDEIMVHEDETVSIWTCRYAPDVVFAPHEHRMGVQIAVYRGAEVEVLYSREPGKLRHGGNHLVRAGDVARLGPQAIHAITADGDAPSIAIHVYEGPLTRIKRALFDWTSGEKIEFSMEIFHAMARRKQDMEEFRG